MLRKSNSSISPKAFAGFVPLCHVLVILTLFQSFLYFHICYSDLRCCYYNCFGISQTLPILKSKHNKPRVCSDCSTHQLFSCLSPPPLRPPNSLRHSNFEIRPVTNPTTASSVQVKGRFICLSLHVKS